MSRVIGARALGRGDLTRASPPNLPLPCIPPITPHPSPPLSLPYSPFSLHPPGSVSHACHSMFPLPALHPVSSIKARKLFASYSSEQLSGLVQQTYNVYCVNLLLCSLHLVLATNQRSSAHVRYSLFAYSSSPNTRPFRTRLSWILNPLVTLPLKVSWPLSMSSRPKTLLC